MKISTPDQMKNIDKSAEDFGIPSMILMENAASAVINELPEADSYLVVCGKGNNGGDGYAIARQLFTMGINVSVCCVEPPTKGDVLKNYELAQKLSIPFVANIAADEYDVIVDALLGTGISTDVIGRYAEIVDLINASSAFVCSVDVPSGVNALTGMTMNKAVCADMTVTFCMAKPGLLFSDKTGELIVSPISIPKQAIDSQNIQTYLTTEDIVMLPERSSTAHKGSCGKLLVISGSVGMTGAAKLCCTSALKTGAGLVRLAIPASLNCAMEASLTEAMTLPCAEEDGALCLESYKTISPHLNSADVVLLGPGLSVSDGTNKLFRKLVSKCTAPMVLDADGLNLLAQNPDLADAECIKIMTPHPVEFSRISGLSLGEIYSDRIGCASAFATAHNTVLVLKGKGTVIALPDGTAYINPTGNEGMATGGSGDVLAGMISALLCQGLSPKDSAISGVYLHGLAGDITAEELGVFSMLPSDLTDRIYKSIEEVEDK